MTTATIREFCREVDSLVIIASSVPEMYRKLNVLNRNTWGGWQTLRHPLWVGDRLVAILLRPDPHVDQPEYFI